MKKILFLSLLVASLLLIGGCSSKEAEIIFDSGWVDNEGIYTSHGMVWGHLDPDPYRLIEGREIVEYCVVVRRGGHRILMIRAIDTNWNFESRKQGSEAKAFYDRNFRNVEHIVHEQGGHEFDEIRYYSNAIVNDGEIHEAHTFVLHTELIEDVVNNDFKLLTNASIDRYNRKFRHDEVTGGEPW